MQPTARNKLVQSLLQAGPVVVASGLSCHPAIAQEITSSALDHQTTSSESIPGHLDTAPQEVSIPQPPLPEISPTSNNQPKFTTQNHSSEEQIDVLVLADVEASSPEVPNTQTPIANFSEEPSFSDELLMPEPLSQEATISSPTESDAPALEAAEAAHPEFQQVTDPEVIAQTTNFEVIDNEMESPEELADDEPYVIDNNTDKVSEPEFQDSTPPAAIEISDLPDEDPSTDEPELLENSLSDQTSLKNAQDSSSEDCANGTALSDNNTLTEVDFESIRVNGLKFECNTIFDSTELQLAILDSANGENSNNNDTDSEDSDNEEQKLTVENLRINDDDASVSFAEQELSLLQLLQIASNVSEYYTQYGYATSGAVVDIPESLPGTVTVRVIEGLLENIEIIPAPPREEAETDENITPVPDNDDDSQSEANSTNQGANESASDDINLEDQAKSVAEENSNSQENSIEQSSPQPPESLRLKRYVRSRLGVRENEVLNVDELQEKLLLLQLDPLISQITAQLSDGSRPGMSRLLIAVDEAPTFGTNLSTNNSRSPSVGTFQRGISLSQANLLGLGDSLSVGYTNTDGSDDFNVGYTIPFTSRNSTIGFRYNTVSSGVIEEPFDDIDGDGNTPDIRSSSSTYEFTVRHPIIRNVTLPEADNPRSTYSELGVGLTLSVRNSKATIFDDIPLSLTPDGRTNVTALRFFQDWVRQNNSGVLSARSEFSLGLDAFGSTILDPIPGVESLPDSEFFAWQGQAQWVQRLSNSKPTLWVLSGGAQFADRPLPSSEQFALGGLGTVRGYRQDLQQTDNGFFASTEVRFPIYQNRDSKGLLAGGLLQIVPFADFGIGWSNSQRDQPSDRNTLASAGLGLQWQQGDLTARLDYGIPLISRRSSNRTWQENGFHFSVSFSPF